MDMTYEEMMEEMDAYWAAAECAQTSVRTLTRHEEMLERLCGKNAEDDRLLAILRKTFSEDEVETWLLCPEFSTWKLPLPAEKLVDLVRPELQNRLPAITEKLMSRKVLLHVKKPAAQGYFARCDEHCVNTLKTMDAPKTEKSGSIIKVLPGKCVGCKLCEKVCPVSAIQVVGKIVAIDDQQCMGCCACVRKCPKQVLSTH